MVWWSLHLLLLAVFYKCFWQCHLVHLVEFNHQQRSGRDFMEHFVHTCFQTTTRRVLALPAIWIWHSLDSNAVGAFISNTPAYSEHLCMKAPAGYDNEWGTASLCKELTSFLCKFPVDVIFFVLKSSGLVFVLGFRLMPVRQIWQVNLRSNFALHWKFFSN